MSKRWVRFMHPGAAGAVGAMGFGTLEGEQVQEHSGSMFDAPVATGRVLALADLTLLAPTQPTKIIALWNNFKALGDKLQLATPPEPLYFLKSPNSWANSGDVIRQPAQAGKVVYEGELGVVIGKKCKNVSVEDAADAIFGVTCVNEVTALDLLTRDASFAQWSRAKSFDTFGIFGPVIASGLNWQTLTVRTLVNGRERQNYPCSDMIFSPAQIVSGLSQEMTLMPGDVIACGTSLGVLPIKPGTVVEVSIDGIGVLKNTYESNTNSLEV